MIRRALVAGAILASAFGPSQIHEDHPAWNCRTMGNRICGTSFGPVWAALTPDHLTDAQMQRAAEDKYRSQSLQEQLPQNN